MASADFSQFVVTTVNGTACETSPVKVRTLSLHAPAAFTRTSGNFGTSVPFATLSVFPSLICGSCPSGQRFACSFFQIPSYGGHPCCSAMCFVVAYAHSGLSPVRVRPCWANKKTLEKTLESLELTVFVYNYSMIVATRPEPTVLPPSRTQASSFLLKNPLFWSFFYRIYSIFSLKAACFRIFKVKIRSRHFLRGSSAPTLFFH